MLSNTAAKIGTAGVLARPHRDGRAPAGIEAIADRVMELWFTRAFHAERADELALWRNMLTRRRVEGYVGCCAAIAETDLSRFDRGLRLPVLALVGDADGSTPPDLVRETADLIVGARFEMIRGAGHIPCVEQPEATAALITRFLQETAAMSDRHAQGMTTRRSVLGDAHVDRAEAAKTAFDEPFQALITEARLGHRLVAPRAGRGASARW